MTLATRNYICYTLASFVIFFDVLALARSLFTEELSVIFVILNVALLLGLFVGWRAKDFGSHPIRYGVLFSILTLLLNFLRPDNDYFWLILIVNGTVFILLILFASSWSPPRPPISSLAFGQEPPRIEQDVAKKYREKLKIAPDDHVLLLYGRPERHKQYDLLLKAIPTLRDLFPDKKVHLVITTWNNQNDEVSRLKTLVRKLDLVKNVLFVKSTDPENLKYIINLANVIVFPYHQDFSDQGDINDVLPYLKALVVPDQPLFAQLVNNKTAVKLPNFKNKNKVAVSIERLLKDEELMIRLGYNLSKEKDTI
ncbi:glycosyltransferase [Patescibacteria group bacterium]